MVQYEVSCSALRRSLRNRQPILRGIRSASASAVSAAGNLAAAGSAFREVSVVLRRISQDEMHLSRQNRKPSLRH